MICRKQVENGENDGSKRRGRLLGALAGVGVAQRPVLAGVDVRAGPVGVAVLVHVLLLARARVLEPDLGDALREARQRRDPLQVLAVRVRVKLEVRLQHRQLLLRERRPHPLRLRRDLRRRHARVVAAVVDDVAAR